MRRIASSTGSSGPIEALLRTAHSLKGAARAVGVLPVEEACHEGDGYCTATLQCDGGHWVPRSSDPDACTSGPG